MSHLQSQPTTGDGRPRKRVASFVGAETEERPLLFHHISKTGGTSLTGVLFGIAVHRGRRYRFLPKRYGDGDDRPPLRLRFSRALVYAGETPFGFERYLPRKPFHRVTIVRHPADRLVSSYFWTRRHRDRFDAIGEDDFRAFLAEEAIHERCARVLSGLAGPAKASDPELDPAYCREVLDSCYACCTTESLDQMASFLLTRYGGPTVTFRDAKKESDPRKTEFVERFREMICERNPLDLAIHEYAARLRHRIELTDEERAVPSSDLLEIENRGGKNFVFRTIES